MYYYYVDAGIGPLGFAVWVLIALILTFAFMAVVYAAVAYLMVKAVVMARITVSLLAALALCGLFPIFGEDNLWALAVWVPVCLAGCFLLCSLPRCGRAFGVSCTLMVSYAIVHLVVLYAATLMSWVGTVYYANEAITQVVMKVLGIVVAAWISMRQPQRKARVVLKNKLMINLERVLASLIYGVTCMFLFMSGNSNAINSNAVIQIGVGVVVFLGSFVADILLTKKMK